MNPDEEDMESNTTNETKKDLNMTLFVITAIFWSAFGDSSSVIISLMIGLDLAVDNFDVQILTMPPRSARKSTRRSDSPDEVTILFGLIMFVLMLLFFSICLFLHVFLLFQLLHNNFQK